MDMFFIINFNNYYPIIIDMFNKNAINRVHNFKNTKIKQNLNIEKY